MGKKMNKSDTGNILRSLGLRSEPFKRLTELKEYLGLSSDTETIRFCLTFTYRKIIEIDKDKELHK